MTVNEAALQLLKYVSGTAIADHPLLNTKLFQLRIHTVPHLCHECGNTKAWKRSYRIIEHTIHKVIKFSAMPELGRYHDEYAYELIGAPSNYLGETVFTPEHPCRTSEGGHFFSSRQKAIDWAEGYLATKSPYEAWDLV